MIYSKYSCPKCNNTIQNYAPKYITFGNPFIHCNKCGATVKMDSINEWEAMSFFKKLDYYFIFYGQVIILSAIGTLLFEIFFSEVLKSEIFIYDDNPTGLGIFLIILVTLVMTIIRHIKFSKAVKQSKERTKNEEYRKQLGIS